MGLDIYFHRTRVEFTGDPTNANDIKNFHDADDAAAKEAFRTFIDNEIPILEEAWERAQTNNYWKAVYNERYFAFVARLRPMIAKNYDSNIHPYTQEILTLPALKEKLEKDLEWRYADYDAYFRKVNCLFAYYENIGKMVDEWFALTDRGDIEDILDRCRRIKEDHSLASRLLPTQSGFFFGDTDFDEWYFKNIDLIMTNLTKFLDEWEEGETGYVVFSW